MLDEERAEVLKQTLAGLSKLRDGRIDDAATIGRHQADALLMHIHDLRRDEARYRELWGRAAEEREHARLLAKTEQATRNNLDRQLRESELRERALAGLLREAEEFLASQMFAKSPIAARIGRVLDERLLRVPQQPNGKAVAP